jgi:CBS domain-containing membrane protein
MQVVDLMTRSVTTLKATDSALQAKEIMMRRRIRHIPIVSAENNLEGLVTQRDVLAATLSRFADVDMAIQEEIDAGIPLASIMNTDVVVVSPDCPIRKAAEVMLTRKLGCLPVVEGQRLVGILTEADFLKLVVELLDALDKSN